MQKRGKRVGVTVVTAFNSAVPAPDFTQGVEFMNQFSAAKPLSFPVRFPDLPSFLIVCYFNYQAARDRLGTPMLIDVVDGLGEADFWAFEFPCGLQVALEFVHHSSCGRVVADSPEPRHVARHLPISEHEYSLIEPAGLRSEIELLLSVYPNRRDEIDGLHAYQVWRQGDDGNPFKIGEPTSERDARCWVQHFESLAHKQVYWFEPSVGQG